MPKSWLLSRTYVLTIMCAVALCAACAHASGTGSVASTPVLAATATASPTPSRRFGIGDVVTIGNAWQVKITGFRVLAPGDTSNVHQVGVDMTLKDLGVQPARLDDGYLLTLLDGSGQQHGIGEQTGICHLTTGEKSCLDALTLNPGTEQSGDIGAVIPVSQTQFTLTIDTTTGVGSAGAVTWALSL